MIDSMTAAAITDGPRRRPNRISLLSRWDSRYLVIGTTIEKFESDDNPWEWRSCAG